VRLWGCFTKKTFDFNSFLWAQINWEWKIFGLKLFKGCFISKFKNRRLLRAEVHRVLLKIKKFVYFWGSVQPIYLITLVLSMESELIIWRLLLKVLLQRLCKYFCRQVGWLKTPAFDHRFPWEQNKLFSFSPTNILSLNITKLIMLSSRW